MQEVADTIQAMIDYTAHHLRAGNEDYLHGLWLAVHMELEVMKEPEVVAVVKSVGEWVVEGE